MGTAGTSVVYVQSDHVRDQIREVFPLISPYMEQRNFMTRCIPCNVSLNEVPRSEVESHVPEYVFHRHDTFRICPSCRRIYWGGSHRVRMSSFIKEVLGDGRLG